MELCKKAIELAKLFESFRAKTYICPAGKLTIGWGHTHNVRPGQTVTETEAEAMLADDMREACGAVDRLVKVPLTTGQYGALVDFVFNVGVGAFQKSTLLKVLNAGDYDAVPHELLRWTHGGGVELPGLIVRRQAEVDLWDDQEPIGLHSIERAIALASAAAVQVQNHAIVEATKAINGGRLDAVVASACRRIAEADVVEALEPFLSKLPADVRDSVRPLARVAIDAACEWFKLPQATLDKFPDHFNT